MSFKAQNIFFILFSTLMFVLISLCEDRIRVNNSHTCSDPKKYVLSEKEKNL